MDPADVADGKISADEKWLEAIYGQYYPSITFNYSDWTQIMSTREPNNKENETIELMYPQEEK